MSVPWHDYALILFDFDDTLVDFAAAEAGAVDAVCRHFGRDGDAARLAAFRRINRALWRRHDAGELTRDEIFRRRFAEFLGELTVEGDPGVANELFLTGLARHATPLPAAAEILAHAAKRAVIGIVSNGHGPTQRQRVAAAGLDRQVKFFAISDEVGAAKPHPKIFAEAYRLSGLPPGAKTLMVGDNLVADIGGAASAGFDTCWIHGGNAEVTEIVPTYAFASLEAAWA